MCGDPGLPSRHGPLLCLTGGVNAGQRIWHQFGRKDGKVQKVDIRPPSGSTADFLFGFTPLDKLPTKGNERDLPTYGDWNCERRYASTRR